MREWEKYLGSAENKCEGTQKRVLEAEQGRQIKDEPDTQRWEQYTSTNSLNPTELCASAPTLQSILKAREREDNK